MPDPKQLAQDIDAWLSRVTRIIDALKVGEAKRQLKLLQQFQPTPPTTQSGTKLSSKHQ